MFCKNCGNQIAEGTKFCANCGTAQDAVNATQQANVVAPAQNFQPIAQQKPKSKGKKIGGIIMAALGGLSILGSFGNDYYWNIAHNGVNMSDFVTIGLQIGLLVGGIMLIVKSKNQE